MSWTPDYFKEPVMLYQVVLQKEKNSKTLFFIKIAQNGGFAKTYQMCRKNTNLSDSFAKNRGVLFKNRVSEIRIKWQLSTLFGAFKLPFKTIQILNNS